MEPEELKNLIINTDCIYNILEDNFQIQLVEDKINQVFKIFDAKNTIYAKVGRRGWSEYEWDSLNSLFEKGYYVPKPIYYIPLQTAIFENWEFGDLKQKNGIIFYHPIKGKSLIRNYNLNNLILVLNFLHKFHKENSKSTSDLNNYQNYEVDRGLNYIDHLKMGYTVNLEKRIKNYANLRIKFSLIHGDARPEHFILNNTRIGMIDLEGTCIGDPFKDFGILLAELFFYNLRLNLQDYSLLEKIFGHTLTENEILRLNFFLIRRLLVNLKYGELDENKKNLINIIEALCEYGD